jgi:hypothetical protein
MKTKGEAVIEPSKNYEELVRKHGCAACIHRQWATCYHPQALERYSEEDGLFGVMISYYVMNSTDMLGMMPNRPVWCPFLEEGWSLESERGAVRCKF